MFKSVLLKLLSNHRVVKEINLYLDITIKYKPYNLLEIFLEYTYSNLCKTFLRCTTCHIFMAAWSYQLQRVQRVKPKKPDYRKGTLSNKMINNAAKDTYNDAINI